MVCALAATTGTASALRVLEPDGSVIVAWGDVDVTRIAPDGNPDGDVHDISPEPHIPSDRLHPEEAIWKRSELHPTAWSPSSG